MPSASEAKNHRQMDRDFPDAIKTGKFGGSLPPAAPLGECRFCQGARPAPECPRAIGPPMTLAVSLTIRLC